MHKLKQFTFALAAVCALSTACGQSGTAETPSASAAETKAETTVETTAAVESKAAVASGLSLIHLLTTVDKIQAETIFQEGIFQEKSGELENVKSDLQKKYLEENTAKIALKQLEGKKEELYESSADMNLENRQLEEQIHELRDSLAAIAGEMKRLEQENTDRNEKIESDSAALELSLIHILKVKSDEENWDNQIAEQNERLTAIDAEIEKLLSQAESLEEEVKAANEEIRRLNRNLSHTEQDYHTCLLYTSRCV